MIRILSLADRKEIAAQVILDSLLHDQITVGQARKLLLEEIGWRPGHAHARILKTTRLSVLKSVEPAKKAVQPAHDAAEKRKLA